MVCRCGRGRCPGRHSLRYTLYRLSRDCRQRPSSRRTATETLPQYEHAMSSWINSSNSIQHNSIFSKTRYFGISLSIELDQISLAQKEKHVLGDSFFSNHSIIQFKPTQKVELDSFFLRYNGPLCITLHQVYTIHFVLRTRIHKISLYLYKIRV